jgi:hypothetical protein
MVSEWRILALFSFEGTTAILKMYLQIAAFSLAAVSEKDHGLRRIFRLLQGAAKERDARV